MLTKKNFTHLLVFGMLVFSIQSFSQVNDSIMRINRKYKTEIGVDLTGLFFKTPGITLIAKVKNNAGRFIDLKSAKNYRFQFGLSGGLPISEDVKRVDTSFLRYSNKPGKEINAFIMVGHERVNFYGRFNLYYGVDFGLSYNYSKVGYIDYAGVYSNYNYLSPTETKRAELSVIPFVGAKYRFSEHFSASIESGFSLAYFISRAVIFGVSPVSYPTTVNTVVLATANQSGITFSMKYLRFLTLNYHF